MGGRGEGERGRRGVCVSFTVTKKRRCVGGGGGGGGYLSAMLKGGHKRFWCSFNTGVP